MPAEPTARVRAGFMVCSFRTCSKFYRRARNQYWMVAHVCSCIYITFPSLHHSFYWSREKKEVHGVSVTDSSVDLVSSAAARRSVRLESMAAHFGGNSFIAHSSVINREIAPPPRCYCPGLSPFTVLQSPSTLSETVSLSFTGELKDEGALKLGIFATSGLPPPHPARDEGWVSVSLPRGTVACHIPAISGIWHNSATS
ncbi:hypothetical protein J6590_076449 [Homalodisca vitripennis]|nr:hypothetical protein J6590_076449 [Homalodisca vitripennis]